MNMKGQKKMATIEIWRTVKGYENLYEVSNLGRVRSYVERYGKLTDKPKILKGQQGKHYKTVTLCKDRNYKTFSIHFLVANAFIPNTQNKKEINHKDGNKLNNQAKNLEWCTHRENMKHAEITKLASFNKKRIFCVETNKHFESVVSASRQTGILRTCIDNCLNGRAKTAGGFTWKYERTI